MTNPKPVPVSYPKHKIPSAQIVTLTAEQLETSNKVAATRMDKVTDHAGPVEHLWTQASIGVALFVGGEVARG